MLLGLVCVWLGRDAAYLNKLEKFLVRVGGDISEGLATMEKAEVRFYRTGRER